MNPLQRIMSVFSRTPNQKQPEQKQVKNSISNDFLRRGNNRAKVNILLDKKIDPDLSVKGWMYAALNLRADSFAEFCEEYIVSENDTDEYQYHPYLELIETSRHTSEFEFWRHVCNDYDIYGQVFIFVLRRVIYEDMNEKPEYGQRKKLHHIGFPVAIECLDSKNVTILKDNQGNVVGYREQLDATHKREFLPEQVIHIMNHSLIDRKKPYSIFDACKDYQYTINKGTQFAQNALLNNMNTPGILSTTEILNDEEYDNLISRINSHEPGKAIVTDGTGELKYTPISQSIDSAALPSLTEVSRQTIFAVTGTSKTILGIEESGVTRETSKVQNKKFITRTIAPLAKRIIAALNFDYRVYYKDIYQQSHIHLAIKSAYDSAEAKEQFNTQKMLFDDITELVYSGYTKESAEAFMYGNIAFSDLELDSEDAEQIDEEQEDIEEPTKPQKDASEKSPEDTGETEEQKNNNNTSVEEDNSIKQIVLENQDSTMHNHTNADDYHLKALTRQMNENGELNEYGKTLEAKIIGAKNKLLKDVRKIQLEAIKNADTKIALNAFDYNDIRNKEEEESLIEKLVAIFKKFWFVLLPVVGKERIQEDKESTGIDENVNLLGTPAIKAYIEEASRKASESHVHTIYKTIVDAANKAEDRIFGDEFAKEYVDNYKEDDKWFKSKPTTRQVKSKLKNDDFVKDNEALYQSVRDKITKGFNRAEIQKAIRQEYTRLSRTRANTLVGNEMARAINNSQFAADYEFLKKTGMLKNAYKRLISGTGDPCPICQAIIDKGDVKFEDPFLKLGDTIQVENDNKTTTFTCNYENVDSGVVHCNCKCRYQLIIKK